MPALLYEIRSAPPLYKVIMKKKIPIPTKLVAKVMFASNMVCCVCRDSSRKTQIHHIDENPSNNDFNNLAVMCKDDHSDAHTKHAFARNLSPELIKEYNQSWRAIVRARVKPGGDSALKIEYRQQLLLEIGLTPHIWKNHYMRLFPGHFNNCKPTKPHADIWDVLLESGVSAYSQSEWEKYYPLFDRTIIEVVDTLHRLLAAHGQFIPVKIKLLILRSSSQLETERSVYLQLLQIIQISRGEENSLFIGRFRSTINILSVLAKISDEERHTLENEV